MTKREHTAVIVLLLALELPLSLWARPQAASSGQSAGAAERATGDFKISMDVNLVVLGVAVRDHGGGSVSGLGRDCFRVYENGRPQEIKLFEPEDVPVTIGLVVDGSGSMMPKRRETIMAALGFLQYSNPDDEMFVVNFNEKVFLGLPPESPFTNERSQMLTALMRFPPAGRTALYDAIATGLKQLERGTRQKKILVVFSDGGDNASRASYADVLAAAEQSNVIIYTIGLFDDQDPDRNPRVLKKLAHLTGGEAYLSGEHRDLVSICKRIAHDIRSQYTIGYAPSAADGAYHSIKVTAETPDHKKLSVRTRTGYRTEPHRD
jgi:VWFA-related protein